MGFRSVMSGVIGRGTHPSKIGTFRVHLTSTNVCTCIKAKWASTGSVKWWLPLHMPPLFESPFSLVSTTTSFSFSLSLSFSLHFAIPSPIRNQPLHPSLPRAFDAILCYQTTNSSENKKTGRCTLSGTDQVLTSSTMHASFVVVNRSVRQLHALSLLFTFCPYPVRFHSALRVRLCHWLCSPLYDLPLMRGPTLLT